MGVFAIVKVRLAFAKHCYVITIGNLPKLYEGDFAQNYYLMAFYDLSTGLIASRIASGFKINLKFDLPRKLYVKVIYRETASIVLWHFFAAHAQRHP